MKTIKLTKGKFALVDDGDYLRLVVYAWYAYQNKTGIWYAAAKDANNKTLRMHRLVLSTNTFVDHIDGNGLNNVRSNLRRATIQQNSFNQRLRSGKVSGIKYKGVTWNKESNKYQAQVMKNGKNFNLGRFTCPVEAAKAYDEKAVELFGVFAKTNRMLGLL